MRKKTKTLTKKQRERLERRFFALTASMIGFLVAKKVYEIMTEKPMGKKE